jgi:hypothetical protein
MICFSRVKPQKMMIVWFVFPSKRLLQKKKSTESVILTKDLKKAKVVHKKASNCGKANLYKVKKLKTKRARYRAPIS